jgi:hypothetical protein
VEDEVIELRFEDFHEQNYEDKGFCLYVLKNGLGDVLYVGISAVDVWSRWFGWGGHMLWDGKVIYGESSIGIKIENHLPEFIKLENSTVDVERLYRGLQNRTIL